MFCIFNPSLSPSCWLCKTLASSLSRVTQHPKFAVSRIKVKNPRRGNDRDNKGEVKELRILWSLFILIVYQCWFNVIYDRFSVLLQPGGGGFTYHQLNATYMWWYHSLYAFISFILLSSISSNCIPDPIIPDSICRGSPLNLPWSTACYSRGSEAGRTLSQTMWAIIAPPKHLLKHAANKNDEKLSWLWTHKNSKAGKWTQSGLLNIQ